MAAASEAVAVLPDMDGVVMSDNDARVDDNEDACADSDSDNEGEGEGDSEPLSSDVNNDVERGAVVLTIVELELGLIPETGTGTTLFPGALVGAAVDAAGLALAAASAAETPDGHGNAGTEGTTKSLGKGGTDGTEGMDGRAAVGTAGTDGTAGTEGCWATADGAGTSDTAAAAATVGSAGSCWVTVSCATRLPFESTVATTSTLTVTTCTCAARRWNMRWPWVMMTRSLGSSSRPCRAISSSFSFAFGCGSPFDGTICGRWRNRKSNLDFLDGVATNSICFGKGPMLLGRKGCSQSVGGNLDGSAKHMF